MANNTGRRAAGAAADEDNEERKPTKRVVLRRERVICLPVSVPEAAKIDLAKLGEALGVSKAEASKVVTGEAWVVVGEFEGSSKDNAIEAHAGKAGTPDAKVGAFKAPTASAWSGGALYEAPPKPLVEKKALV